MHVTVCICTRNRGASIAITLRSLAASTYDDFDVMIVDQSTADDTAEAIKEVTAGDDRFSYLRSPTVGLSVARNIAIMQARGPIIAFTDDDCEVGPDWLAALVSAFRQYRDVGQICGAVRAIPFDPTLGEVRTYEVERCEQIASPWALWRAEGIGANVAFRQEALRAAGLFDERLGAGTAVHAGEDIDMTYRVLKAGYQVLNTPEAYVIHHAFRPFEQNKLLMRRAYLGIAAMHAKHLRLGDLEILPAMIYTWLFSSISWKNLLLFRGKTGLARLLYYARGVCLSFRYSIDRRWRIYRVDKAYGPTPAQVTDAILPLPD